MKLHILSDLHTEFADFELPETDADVVVLAGDIGVGTSGLEWALQQFSDRPVIYVPGNHEFYGHDIRVANELFAGTSKDTLVLDDESCVIDGVRFLGSTLWTDFEFDGKGEAWLARQRARQMIRDFTTILYDNRRFTPEDAVDLHRKSTAWLIRELEKEFAGPTVVVTHHLPAAPSVARQYRSDPLNPAVGSRLEGIIEQFHPELWIHGHTHVACDYEIYGTRVVCNPRGYPSEHGSEGFRPDLIIEIQPDRSTNSPNLADDL